MGTKVNRTVNVVRSNYRVIVLPRELGDFGGIYIGRFGNRSHDEWVRELDAIREQVERHVDGLPSRHTKTYNEWDTEYVCPFCGRCTEPPDKWPECCDEAQKEAMFCGIEEPQ